jgi:hypothetical protein
MTPSFFTILPPWDSNDAKLRNRLGGTLRRTGIAMANDISTRLG